MDAKLIIYYQSFLLSIMGLIILKSKDFHLSRIFSGD